MFYSAAVSSSQLGRERSRQRADHRPLLLTPPTTEPVRPSPPPPTPGSIAERHHERPPVDVTVELVIEGEEAEKLWETYRVNFAPLGELAALQHVFSREEILDELADPRIQKIVGWEGAEPVGLGMVTNELECVPQMSPEFLRARYPEHAARNAIYYGILVAVSSPHRGLTLFNRVYTTLWQIAAADDGVLAFDICKFNRDAFDADSLIDRIASNFPDSSVRVADQQTWWVAELPKPIPGS